MTTTHARSGNTRFPPGCIHARIVTRWRYALAMGRNAVTRETATESFAGLLGRLTGYPIPETREPTSGSRNQAAVASDLLSGMASGRSPAKASEWRADELAPDSLSLTGIGGAPRFKAAANQSGRRNGRADVAELSYEQALQRHTQRKPAAVVRDDVFRPAHAKPNAARPGNARPDNSSPGNSRPGSALSTAAIPATPKVPAREEKLPATRNRNRSSGALPSFERANAADQGRHSAPAPSLLFSPSGPAPGAHRDAEMQRAFEASRSAKPARKTRLEADSKAKIQASAKQRIAAPCVPDLPVATMQDLEPTPVSRTGIGQARIRPGRISQSSPKQRIPSRAMQPADLDQAAANELEDRQLPQVQENAEFQLAAIHQRNSIVSIRLTDWELARLRDRAGESGISVSAYMRSCVLEAETLRTQVKQAMAEMRSLTLAPGRLPLHSLAVSQGERVETSGDWVRSLVRTMVLLLSPLFPFRRSA